MHQVRLILLLALIAFSGCDQGGDAKLFKPWGWEDINDGRARLDGYKHVLVARIDEHNWEDLGQHRKTPHHFKAVVIKSYKGDWRVSEQISFVHHVDSPAPTGSATNGPSGNLIFIFTSEHTMNEITLDTGEWGNYWDELEPGLNYLFPRKG